MLPFFTCVGNARIVVSCSLNADKAPTLKFKMQWKVLAQLLLGGRPGRPGSPRLSDTTISIGIALSSVIFISCSSSFAFCLKERPLRCRWW